MLVGLILTISFLSITSAIDVVFGSYNDGQEHFVAWPQGTEPCSSFTALTQKFLTPNLLTACDVPFTLSGGTYQFHGCDSSGSDPANVSDGNGIVLGDCGYTADVRNEIFTCQNGFHLVLAEICVLAGSQSATVTVTVTRSQFPTTNATVRSSSTSISRSMNESTTFETSTLAITSPTTTAATNTSSDVSSICCCNTAPTVTQFINPTPPDYSRENGVTTRSVGIGIGTGIAIFLGVIALGWCCIKCC